MKIRAYRLENTHPAGAQLFAKIEGENWVRLCTIPDRILARDLFLELSRQLETLNELEKEA